MIKLASRLQSPESARVTQEQVFPGPVESGKDYAGIAETAWLAAQVAAWEALETEATLALLADRLGVAEAWFAEHDDSDPLYRKAEWRRNRLEREQRLLEQQHWFQLRTCWTACCQLWQALSLMTAREAWEAAHAPEIDAESFETVWRSAIGDRLLPDGLAYPPSKHGREYVVPFAAWQRDELGEQRATQQAKAKQRSGRKRKVV